MQKEEVKKEDATGSGDEMDPTERLLWLRERGVTVETSEDRRRKTISKILNEGDELEGEKIKNVSFVHVPQDDSLPIKELTMNVSTNTTGDFLMEYLKPFFSALSKKVDLDLLKDQATKHFGSGDGPAKVSEKSLQEVSSQGQVECFCLVQPVPSNKFISINMYLDEVGMLKRLPLNKRAGSFALKAGYNPAPMFYGDVFIGRLSTKPVLKNVDFKLGLDTSPEAKWLKAAVTDNLEHRLAMNSISGNHDQVQPPVDGEDGVPKLESGGYEWIQTDEEIEITLPLDKEVLTSKDVKIGGLKVKYYPNRLIVLFREKEILSIYFYANIDPDGCTWTLDDSSGNGISVIITCEKSDPTAWPRILK